MIECEVLPNGDLKIVADAEAQSYIAEKLPTGYWGVFAEIFEGYSCNGSLTPFDGGDGNPFVGLTSAPCIAESMTTESDGAQKVAGRTWWYPRYMTRDPLDDLAETGATVFTLAT